MNMSELETEYQNQNNLEPSVIADKMLADDKELNLCKDYHFITLKDTKEMLYYDHDKGIYKPNGEVLIEEYCKKEVPDCSTHFRSEVINHIKILTYQDRSIFDDDPNYIVLANGVYDITIDQLTEHSPHDPKRIQIPIEYDPTAKCSNILKFLSEVQPEEDAQTFLLEELAACLWRSQKLQRWDMHQGEGNNGKSTWLELVRRFLGLNNVCSIPLQILSINRFASAELENKLACLFADISDAELKTTGNVKTMTGNDTIRGERKFRDPFYYTPYAKLIFSCNKLPMVNDDTTAFFRRVRILEWNQRFDGDKRDPAILDKITTPEELSGLFNLILPILKKLMEKGEYMINPTSEQTREEWLRKADYEQQFITDVIEISPQETYHKADLYAVYIKYCQDKKWTPIGNTKFNQVIAQKTGAIATTIRENGKTPKVWKGLKIKECFRCFHVSTDIPKGSLDNSIEVGIRRKTGNSATMETFEGSL